MQRYFINHSIEDIHLSSNDLHHLLVVLRAKVGDQFEVVDSHQDVYLVCISEIINKEAIKVKVLEKYDPLSVELPIHITIATGLSKNDKLDWIVQKATELGMNQFQPVALQRDVVVWKTQKSEDKLHRLNKIAQGACEQSKRLAPPHIQPLMNLKDLIQHYKDYDVKLVAYEEEAKDHHHFTLKQVIQQIQPNQSLICLFGSEGGFDSKEVELLEQAGYLKCSLGPRILRAETAPLYLLSAISYELELK